MTNPTKFMKNFNSRLFDYELGILGNPHYSFFQKFKLSQQDSLRKHYYQFDKYYSNPKIMKNFGTGELSRTGMASAVNAKCIEFAF